ncbi:hypothetical protein [Kitasatospora sp. NPDC090308]|uniref:hypothetical protein n=1 Tax=Kitasatospora sp. NPDC090308 TaxID=3364082 RepID=UPI00382F9505
MAETAGTPVMVSRTLQAQDRPAEAGRELRAGSAGGGRLKSDAEALLRTALATLLRRAGRHPEADEEIGRVLVADASPAWAVRTRHANAAPPAELGRHREAAERYAEQCAEVAGRAAQEG